MKKFNKEVEVKARVEDFSKIIKKLTALGCKLSEPIAQNDTNYIDDKNTFPKITPGCVVLRIREQGDKILLTYKQAVTNELDKIERELEISDREQMEDIIKLLGYHKIIEIKKSRVKTKYKDYEICLDEVENLGTFIEVESLTDDDGEEVQEKLMEFLESIGVSRNDRVEQGYDTLLWDVLNKN